MIIIIIIIVTITNINNSNSNNSNNNNTNNTANKKKKMKIGLEVQTHGARAGGEKEDEGLAVGLREAPLNS